MKQNYIFRAEDYLFATPCFPFENDRPVQDALGVMMFVRALQNQCFPQFTVLTGVRKHSERLLVWTGLSEQIQHDCLKGWSRNRRCRAIELLWACAQLASSKGNKSAIEGVLNLRRFWNFWESRSGSHLKLPTQNDSACFQNLGYGISPHYRAALREWGLVLDADGAEKLTENGRRLYNALVSKNRQKRLLGYVSCWMDPKQGLDESELVKVAKDFNQPCDTFDFWYKQAEYVAQRANGAFPAIWWLVGKHCQTRESCQRFANELLRDSSDDVNVGIALRRWVEKKAVMVQDNELREELLRAIVGCRELELIEGSARFVLDAMVYATKEIKATTASLLAKRWSKWLMPLAVAFERWVRECENKQLQTAFAGVSAAHPESLLNVVLRRHQEVKMSQVFITTNRMGEYELTEEHSPEAPGIENMLKNLDEEPSLPSDPYPERNLVWRSYGVRDWHWERFAAWMRIDSRAQGVNYEIAEREKAIKEGIFE